MASFSVASQQENPNASQAATRADTDNKGAKQSPLVVEVQAMPERSREERDEQAADRQDKAHTDRWIVRLTGIIAVFTVVLAVATGFLWKATRDLVREAEDSSAKGLRAYLNVFECYAQWEAERCLLLRNVFFTVQFKNTGQTPARKVACWANISNGAGPPKFDGPAGEPREHMGVSAPNQTGTMHFKQQFDTSNIDQVEAWERGEETLYVYGKVVYCDAFEQERTTVFRYVMPPNGVNEKRGYFQHAGEGNDWT